MESSVKMPSSTYVTRNAAVESSAHPLLGLSSNAEALDEELSEEEFPQELKEELRIEQVE